MKRLLVGLALAGFLCMPGVAAEQTAVTGGVIGGMVRNVWSKAPIKRAIVTLRTTGKEIMEALAYSEANGAFAFTGIPPGEYTLCARLNGYERACFGDGDDAGRPVSLIALAPGQRKQDIVLGMLPNGSVSGTVLDQDGDAVANARVQLLRPLYARRKLTWQIAGAAMTNDKGDYHLTFVRPGDYRVMASGQFQPVVHIRPEAVVGSSVPEEIFSPQFYPGASSIETASSLTLNAGNDLKGIDFNLGTTPQLMVNVAVQNAAAIEADSFVNVQFFPESHIPGEQVLSFGTNGPEYNLQAGVPAGRYRVVASMDAKDHEYRAEQMVEARSATDNIALTLVLGTPLAGKLIVEGEAIAKQGPYSVNLTAGDDSGTNVKAVDVEEDGSFEFASVFPGVWDIGVKPVPAGSYIKSMRLGDQDVLTADMKLGDGSRKPLTIVLSTRGAIVSGNVVMRDGSALSATVRSRLLLAPSGKYENVLSFYKTTLTDGNGHFEFKGIGPGTYRIFAFDRFQLAESSKPDFLKPFTAAAGDPFEVAEGARVAHDTTLIIRNEGVTE